MAKKKLNLDTAKQVDGALPTVRSVYDLVGAQTLRYRETSFGSYQSRLRRMNLLELHDHAFEVGEVPSPSQDAMIDRLERRFLRENPDLRPARAEDDEKLSMEERALRVMRR